MANLDKSALINKKQWKKEIGLKIIATFGHRITFNLGIYILNYTNIYHYTIFSIVVYVNITNSFENYKLCFLPSSKLSINSLHSFLTSEDSKVILKSSISNLT